MKSKGVFVRKIGLLPIVVVTPLLFMGNAPAPFNPPHEYSSFEVTSITYIPERHEGKNDKGFSIDIKNIGSDYMLIDYLSVLKNGDGIGHLDDYSNCLASNEGGTFEGDLESFIVEADLVLEELEFHTYAITPTEVAVYESISFAREKELDMNMAGQSYYYFDFKKLKTDSSIYHSFIITAKVEGEIYHFYESSDVSNGVFFRWKSGVAPEDISIEKIELVPGRKRNVYSSIIELFFGLGVIGIILFILAVTVVGALAIAAFFFFIIAPVVVLIVRPWKKRNKNSG